MGLEGLRRDCPSRLFPLFSRAQPKALQVFSHHGARKSGSSRHLAYVPVRFGVKLCEIVPFDRFERFTFEGLERDSM